MNAPLLKTDWRQTAWLAAAVLGILALLIALQPILGPFIAALILAYVLIPGVNWLQKRGLPRALAATLMILLLIIALLLFALMIVSVLQHELPLLRERVPQLLGKLNSLVSPRLAEFGIRVRLDLPNLNKWLSAQLASSPDEVIGRVVDTLLISGNAALTVIGNLLFVPLVMFYLLIDWEALTARVAGFIPRAWLPKISALTGDADHLLSRYLRGQLLVMGILAVYYATALALAGFDLALPIGLFTGLAVFIPYIGFGVGLAMALLAALMQFGSLYGFAAVAVIYGIGQVVESFFLTPRLVGGSIGMHPLAVIFLLLAFAQLFGFAGVLLALPAGAILMVLLRELRVLYLASRIYRQ